MPSAERRPRARPTLRSVLRETARRLKLARVSFGHGTTNAYDEAAWLSAHALGIGTDALELHLDRALSAHETRQINRLVDARIRTRKPTAYLLKEAWLGEHRFYVDERVIVPRSYIAELLQEALRPWVTRANRVRSALDLCTGSGCLAVLLALTFPRSRIDASDISRDALHVARRNITEYRVSERVSLVTSNLYSKLRKRSYDVIVSNPPYVREAVMRRLPAEYRKEPVLALAGGRDGLDLVKRIVAEAALHLNPGGLLIVEVGHNRKRVEAAFPGLPLIWTETSGGDDCVFLITREMLLAAAPAHSPRATRAIASPRRQAKSSPARASGAAAAPRRRNARASAGSR
jgi:ribosomal protein L3 glutamine methyltransferase